MKKISVLIFIFAIICLAGCGGSGDDSGKDIDISGVWNTTETAVEGTCSNFQQETENSTYTVIQNGNRLTVNSEITGTINGNSVSWTAVDDNGDRTITTTFTGTVNGTTITGTANWVWSDGDSSCTGKTEITARKAAPGNYDVTGEWDGNWDSTSQEYSGSFTAPITQTGETLSGKISVAAIGMTDATLTGTYSNGTMVFGDIDNTITFSGSLSDGDNASGTFTCDYGGMTVTGTWSGIRFNLPED